MSNLTTAEVLTITHAFEEHIATILVEGNPHAIDKVIALWPKVIVQTGHFSDVQHLQALNGTGLFLWTFIKNYKTFCDKKSNADFEGFFQQTREQHTHFCALAAVHARRACATAVSGPAVPGPAPSGPHVSILIGSADSASATYGVPTPPANAPTPFSVASHPTAGSSACHPTPVAAHPTAPVPSNVGNSSYPPTAPSPSYPLHLNGLL
ncbi:hypothetical protein CPB84DRAFT_1852099 [Gymnopilus junonius]|uniref:Uncharacterized protein n=1 Tax=Gymnopilus junonius TaxID=109634 RepID=A0A9P5TI90_GYMJU|nr:hypothetical protein CPB84DRAFT_1852099 [Gymnopilus junonius]